MLLQKIKLNSREEWDIEVVLLKELDKDVEYMLLKKLREEELEELKEKELLKEIEN